MSEDLNERQILRSILREAENASLELKDVNHGISDTSRSIEGLKAILTDINSTAQSIRNVLESRLPVPEKPGSKAQG